MSRVVVVTDSTASLPAEIAQARGIRVVPLQVVIGAEVLDEIVSIHLSGEMSGTFESAQLAALEVDLPVHVVDSGQVGIATGYAALTAADVLDAGGTAEEAALAALAQGQAATSLFYVDTLEYLRRGGRLGAAAAIVGSALSVKPLLEIAEGRVAPRER